MRKVGLFLASLLVSLSVCPMFVGCNDSGDGAENDEGAWSLDLSDYVLNIGNATALGVYSGEGEDVATTSVKALAKKVPVCHGGNFSAGVAVLKRAVALAVKYFERLGFEYDLALTEKHHATKRDRPSGTAKELMEIITRLSSGKNSFAVVGEENFCKDKGGAQIACFRCGGEVGEHTVEFVGEGQKLTIAHNAWSKSIFADGALTVAKKICNESAGWYCFEDFIFKKGEV